MKLLIFSDIHGSSYYANKLKEIVSIENPDKIVLLGDLYYHGPRNNLSQEYAPMEVAKVLNELKDKLMVVRGNCDAEVDEMISEFKFEDHIFDTINGKRVYFTHGHKYNIEKNSYVDLQKIDKSLIKVDELLKKKLKNNLDEFSLFLGGDIFFN